MRRLVALALRTLPRTFREKYGHEIELDFTDAWRASRGVLARARLVAVTLLDVARVRWMLWRGEGEGWWGRRVLGRAGPARPRGRRSFPMEQLWLDTRLAFRALGKRWTFTLLGLVTLALGIGAVTAVFSVVKAVLLSPLPYADSERIAILWHDLGDGAQSLPALNPLDLFDYRERSETFEDWTVATGFERILGDVEDPELVDVGYVAANFFSFFGVQLLHGREFTAEEDAPGGARVVILSHRLWVRRFGGDPAVVGRTIPLGGADREVVGILPASFRLRLPPEAFRLRDAEAWTPAQIDPKTLPPRNYTGYTGFGKLKAGVSFEEAQQEMDRLGAQLRQEHAVHEAAHLRVRAVPLHADVVKRARPNLSVLLLAVGFVLLIACGNTAQLLLARWRRGERELSLRAALGASRWRLARLVVVESLLLSLGACALGVLLARLGVSLLPRFAAASLPRMDEVRLDLAVLAFALGTAVAAALVFSLVPAVSLSRENLAGALAEAGRASSSRRQVRLGNVLIVGEVALSVLLLVATGLTIRSFQSLLEADPGFQAKGLLTLRLSLPQPEFSEGEARRLFHDELRRRVASQPGVVSIAETNQLPLTGSGTLQPFAYDEETATNWESVTADERFVSPGYFQTMGVTLLAGRELDDDDARIGGRKVAVIDESLAKIAFPGKSAIGQHLRVEPLGHEDPFTEIVGVAAHQRLHDLTRPLLPQIFFPEDEWWSATLVVRVEGDPEALVGPIRGTIRSLAGGVAIEEVAPMEELVAAARAPARLSLVLLVGFGFFAVVLAAIGLFGVVSYAVSLRRQELAIRMALGATPGGIRRKVLGEGAILVAFSVALGFAGAALLGHFLAGVLYRVSPVDPWTYGAVAATLALVALVACWAPAERATRVDLAQSLRGDSL